MAKAPRPGFSKTRLSPPLSRDQSAALSAAFLRDTTENIALASHRVKIKGFAAYAPAGLERLFDGHLASGTELILADGAGDFPREVSGFGRCLLHAITGLLELGYGSACVLNSDGPTLPTSMLVKAAEELSRPGDRAVLGPAEDGGYYLLGLKRAHPRMFENIDWSTDRVAEQTIARAASIGVELVELRSWFDIDDEASLRRLVASRGRTPDDGFPAPTTWACIDRLELGTLLSKKET